ncbi:hypothetical protein WDV85_15105 [Pseudokineococcus sp. 5B2Z-1]|uniref:hypothetical protein n=1 Tax=Pseudokineococcus sp. 5B2Z-1 TaxID=3132744 RepID=UPI0030B7E685
MPRRRPLLPEDLSGATAEDLLAALRRARGGELDRLVGRLVAAGEVGDRLLAEVLPLARPSLGVAVAAGLGDVRGPAGDAALREVLHVGGAGTSDLRTVATLSLAKRGGAAASADLVSAWGARDWGTRMSALHCLAAVGDDRAASSVHGWLARRLRARRAQAMAMPTDVVLGLAYLLRHASPDAPALVALVRERWARLEPEEQEWVGEQWPGAAPGGPPPEEVAVPDAELLRGRVADDALLGPSDWSGSWEDAVWTTTSVDVPDGRGGVAAASVAHLAEHAPEIEHLLRALAAGAPHDGTGRPGA